MDAEVDSDGTLSGSAAPTTQTEHLQTVNEIAGAMFVRLPGKNTAQ